MRPAVNRRGMPLSWLKVESLRTKSTSLADFASIATRLDSRQIVVRKEVKTYP